MFLSTTQHQSYPQHQPQYYSYYLATNLYSHTTASTKYTHYHTTPSHHTRHKISDITKDYIYIDIIYHMTIKSCQPEPRDPSQDKHRRRISERGLLRSAGDNLPDGIF